MRLGILSDTHDQLERTRRAIDLLRSDGAEALIHCGDIMGPDVLEACTVLPCSFVFGNNDDDISALRQMANLTGANCMDWGSIITLAGKRIGVTHGHMSVDVRRLLAQQPDYLFSGHSHIPMDQQEGTVRRINPGALHRAVEFTVALLEVESGELRFLTVPR
ncbi:MAG: YfcE family phosphodiesterase [Planctomycetes bacterium]|nr:YfcE family phosphodiesterase [Planctomycetota bacterium]